MMDRACDGRWTAEALVRTHRQKAVGPVLEHVSDEQYEPQCAGAIIGHVSHHPLAGAALHLRRAASTRQSSY